MQWYECGQHDDNEHAAAMGAEGAGLELEQRVSLINIREWLGGLAVAGALTPAAPVGAEASVVLELINRAEAAEHQRDELTRERDEWRALAENATKPKEEEQQEEVTPEAAAAAAADVEATQAEKQAEADRLELERTQQEIVETATGQKKNENAENEP